MIKTNSIIALFLSISFAVSGQSLTKKDTIQWSGNSIIIELPSHVKVKTTNYEEGLFKVFNCVLDTVIITVHCGSMVNLPLTDLKDKVVTSEFVLGDDLRIIRGYYKAENMDHKERKYFREDNYLKYGINISYENVTETKINYYEQIFYNIKIIKNRLR